MNSTGLHIDDLRREKMIPVLTRLFSLNPGIDFSLERVHDHLITHFQVDLDNTTSAQRSNFYDRMRRTLQNLEECRLITRRTQKTAMRGGRRTIYRNEKSL